MNDPLPLISVVIPVYNGEAFLAESVGSVLAQGYPRIEIIVVDDGSTDATREIAGALPVRYVLQPNQGPPAARNRGLSLATGEVVALLDADDLWPPDKLGNQLPFLLRNPDIDIVLGWTRYFRRRGDSGDTELSQPMFVIQLGCALFRARLAERLGGFDESLRYGDDVDWFYRTREQEAGTLLVNRTTIHYRRHDANMTIAPGHQGPSRTLLLKRSLDRRRALGRLNLPPWPPTPVEPLPLKSDWAAGSRPASSER